MAKLGKDILHEFLLDTEHTFLNHGSYGTVAKRVHEEQIRLLGLVDKHPDNWFRRLYPKLWKECREVVSEFVGSDPENLVFVENATNACNAVVKSINLGPGDAIGVNSWTYNAINNACKAAKERVGAEVVTFKIEWPIGSREEYVKKYDEFLSQNTNIRIVIIDHISSPTATLFPIEELIKVCHKRDVLAYIDGAHAPGQLQLRLDELGADFYAGNFHKWVFTPRGCAILWVHPKHHGKIHPAVTSHNLHHNPWHEDFRRQGARDYTPFVTSPEAIRFYKGIGGVEAAQKHNCALLDKAVEMLTKALGTKKSPIPRDMEAPFMRLVGLPPLKKYPAQQAVFGDLDGLQLTLFERFHIQTAALSVHGEGWIRLSAQVYNCMEDYEKLKDALLIIIKEDQES